MILKDLINRHHWAGVKYHLLEVYPDEEDQIDAYALAYETLIRLLPKPTSMRIVIEQVFRLGLDDEPFIDVSGRDGTLQKELDEFKYSNASLDSAFANSEVSYAIEFRPWDEWLGMEIEAAALTAFSEEAILAHCLWEMTFVGFDEITIQEAMSDLEEAAEEVKNMTEEELKERSISFEELKKDLDIEESEPPSDSDED